VGELELSVVVDAERMEIDERLMERLKETCRFARGPRRCAEGVSVGRAGEELVWRVHGVRSEDCIRQPRAAVRRVGAVPSILK